MMFKEAFSKPIVMETYLDTTKHSKSISQVKKAKLFPDSKRGCTGLMGLQRLISRLRHFHAVGKTAVIFEAFRKPFFLVFFIRHLVHTHPQTHTRHDESCGGKTFSVTVKGPKMDSGYVQRDRIGTWQTFFLLAFSPLP